MSKVVISETSGGVARRGALDRPLLLYEGKCRFCRGAARLLARLDRHHRLALLPFDDPRSAEHLVFLTEEQLCESWQLIEPDGRRRIKGDALVRLLELLPPFQFLGRLLARLRLQVVATVVDQAISKLRPYLARVIADGDAPILPPKNREAL